ncbi:MAG: glycosyltransferase [Burkholderiales bacterium]|nr:glycosyltransferase [Burkholderiales bacterium]
MSRPPPDPDRLVREAEQHFAARRFADAERCLREALALAPRHPEALHRLGVLAFSAGHPGDAERLIRDSLAVVRDNAAAWVNLGLALNALQRFAEAVEAQRVALTLAPTLESAHINQAGPLQALGRIDEAVVVLERAVELNAERPETWNNLGNLYKEQGRIADALAAYDRALALNPQMQEAFSNRLAAMKLCADMTPTENHAWHRKWSGWFEAVERDHVPLDNSPDPDRRLRIAYLSPDCHTAVPAFIRPVWRHHDRDAFEVFVYRNHAPAASDADLPAPGPVRVMAGRSDEDVARMIRADRVDILIDLAGHTGRNRLGVIARQPAPVQMTWLDYLGTTGLDAMHWRITDAVADPPGQTEAMHAEQLLRMPHTQWCWEPPADAPKVTPLPARSAGHLRFGSFNNYSKLTDATLRIWRELLRALPDATLLVAGAPEGKARERLIAALDVSPERLQFSPRVSEQDYRALIGSVDIALDPTPFSGATTTLDALWQGVPVATVGGPFPWSRSTASLLPCLGLGDWVFDGSVAFIEAMRQRADDLSSLAALRAGLRERVADSPITDAAAFTAALDANIRKVWQAWCAAQSDAATPSRTNWDARFGTMCASLAAGDAAGAFRIAMSLYSQRPSAAALHAELARAALAAMPAPVELPPAPAAPRQSIAFIICSIRPDKLAAIRARIEHLFRDHDVEVIGLTDARSLSEAYNRGATQARSRWLVFSHDDIALPQEDFADRLFAHLAAHDLIGMAGASKLVDGHWERAGWPHLHGQILHRPPDAPGQGQGWVYYCAGLQASVMTGITALDGVFLACRREVWDAVQFDADIFDGFHLYDIDFSHRAARAGFRLAVPTDLLLVHDSTGRYDAIWQRYNERFLKKFPDQRGTPPAHRLSSLNVKLGTLEQVLRLRAALLQSGFGSPPETGSHDRG